jgi:hypothetical protein
MACSIQSRCAPTTSSSRAGRIAHCQQWRGTSPAHAGMGGPFLACAAEVTHDPPRPHRADNACDGPEAPLRRLHA